MFEPCMRFLIDKLIEIQQVKTTVKPGEYELNWVGAFEINPRDKAATFLDECRARELETNWMTVNEIRSQLGLQEIDGGDVILGLLKTQAALIPGAASNNRASRRKTELMKKFGKPVDYLLAERIKRGDSVHKICEELGISTDTYYRWAEEYGLYSTLKTTRKPEG